MNTAANLGAMVGINSANGGLSSLERLVQASSLPHAGFQFQNGLGGLGQFVGLTNFTSENPVLAAQARAYAMGMQMPNLMGGAGMGMNHNGAMFNPGMMSMMPSTQQMLANQDMAMRLAFLNGNQGMPNMSVPRVVSDDGKAVENNEKSPVTDALASV